MGKRFILSEDEKLNIRDLYKGLINEQQTRREDPPRYYKEPGRPNRPDDEIRTDKKPTPGRITLPIADKFCDVLCGKAQLKKGAEGELVEVFQQALVNCSMQSLDNSFVDGDFGDKTREAVREFQRRHGLTVDGGIGKETSSKMCQLGCLDSQLCSTCPCSGGKEDGGMVGPIMGDIPVEGRVGVDCEQVHKCISEFMEGLTEDFCVDEDKVRGLIKCVGLGKCFEEGLKKQIPGTGGMKKTIDV